VGGFFTLVRPRPRPIQNHRRRSSLIYPYITRSNSPRSVHVLRSSSWLANVRRRPNRVTWLEYGLRRRERSLFFFGELSSSWDTAPVSGREQFSPFIRRPFSPKHEATNRQDRPMWAVFRILNGCHAGFLYSPVSRNVAMLLGGEPFIDFSASLHHTRGLCPDFHLCVRRRDILKNKDSFKISICAVF